MLYSRHSWPFFKFLIENVHDSFLKRNMCKILWVAVIWHLEIYHSIILDIAAVNSKLTVLIMNFLFFFSFKIYIIPQSSCAFLCLYCIHFWKRKCLWKLWRQGLNLWMVSEWSLYNLWKFRPLGLCMLNQIGLLYLYCLFKL